MTTDILESMGQKPTVGNNITTNSEPDTRTDTDRRCHLSSQGRSERTGVVRYLSASHCVPLNACTIRTVPGTRLWSWIQFPGLALVQPEP